MAFTESEIDFSDLSKLKPNDLIFGLMRGYIDNRRLFVELGMDDQAISQMIRDGERAQSGQPVSDLPAPLQLSSEERELILAYRAGKVTIDREGLVRVLVPDEDADGTNDGNEPDNSEPPMNLDYDNMTVEDLRVLLVQRVDAEGNTLSIEGRKKDLVDRLKEDDERLLADNTKQ